jgi:hypothetical protein
MGYEAKLVGVFRDYLSYVEVLKRQLEAKNLDGTLTHCTQLIGELRTMDFFVEGVLGFEKVHATLMDKMASVYNIMSYAKMGKWDMVLAEHAKLLDPPLENTMEKASDSFRRYLSGAEIASVLSNITKA